MKKTVSIWAAFLICAIGLSHAFAVESPITFARGDILIETKSQPLLFNAEIRDAENAARSPGWYNYAVPDAKKAAMLTHIRPSIARVTTADGFAPVDILFVDTYGIIRQIMPSLVPAELSEPVSSTEPVLAVIYLKSGTALKAGIQPGNHVSHAIFAKKPVVLTEENTPAIPAATPPATDTSQASPITALFPSDPAKPLVPAGKKTGDLMVLSPTAPAPVQSATPPVKALTPPAAPVNQIGPTPEQEKEAAAKRDLLVERVLRNPSQQIAPPRQ